LNIDDEDQEDSYGEEEGLEEDEEDEEGYLGEDGS
jgi:hypothetical protein